MMNDFDENAHTLILSLFKTLGNVGVYLEENQKRRKEDKEDLITSSQQEQTKIPRKRKQRKLKPPIEALDTALNPLDQRKAEKVLQTMRLV